VTLSRYPDAGDEVDRDVARGAIGLMDRAWALFEPRILEFLEDQETADDPGCVRGC